MFFVFFARESLKTGNQIIGRGLPCANFFNIRQRLSNNFTFTITKKVFSPSTSRSVFIWGFFEGLREKT